MELNYETKDKSIRVKLVYLSKPQLRYYHTGKNYPKITQCLLFYNDLLLGFGEVIKCNSDEHNLNLAYRLATKKVINLLEIKSCRKDIWELVLKSTE